MIGQAGSGAAISVPGSSARFAYAFYATDDRYAVAAAVAALALHRLGVPADTDIVILHHGVGGGLLRSLRKLGIHTVAVDPLPFAESGYFEHAFTKLRVLQLLQFERVIFLDADSLPLRPIDNLFKDDWDGAIAAPPAYWLPETRLATTALFAFKPSPRLFERAARFLPDARVRRLYDMDVVNLAFADDLHWLPAEYLCLNAEYADSSNPTYFGDPTVSFARVRMIHFSDLGKPWSYTPQTVRRMRPRAHAPFHEIWRRWWELREDVIATARPIDRLRLRWRALRAIRRRSRTKS